ncbi:hypothetical protein BKI52_36485 [marine bacterium AO1-C]|nr:hypothetical protein BKI52_36485 [marine bacterium AO1-C]
MGIFGRIKDIFNGNPDHHAYNPDPLKQIKELRASLQDQLSNITRELAELRALKSELAQVRVKYEEMVQIWTQKAEQLFHGKREKTFIVKALGQKTKAEQQLDYCITQLNLNEEKIVEAKSKIMRLKTKIANADKTYEALLARKKAEEVRKQFAKEPITPESIAERFKKFDAYEQKMSGNNTQHTQTTSD